MIPPSFIFDLGKPYFFKMKRFKTDVGFREFRNFQPKPFALVRNFAISGKLQAYGQKDADFHENII